MSAESRDQWYVIRIHREWLSGFLLGVAMGAAAVMLVVTLI